MARSLAIDLWKVLTPRQRLKVLGAQTLALFMAGSTVLGIASIAPFFSVLGNPSLVDGSRLLHTLYGCGFSSPRAFTLALGLGFMGLVLLANVVNLLGSFVMIRLAFVIGTDLQALLYGEYLSRPYTFHARTQSAVVFNNVMHETTRATNHILQNVFALVTSLVTGAFIIASVLVVNPAIGAVTIVALAGGYGLFYLAARDALIRGGEVESKFFVEQTKIVNESLGAIREILLLKIQGFFRGHFERASRAVAAAAARAQIVGQCPKYVMEGVAVIGLVTLALWLERADGIGPWLGRLTFLAFAAYRLLPTLQQAFLALVRIRADAPGFAVIAPDLILARTKAPLPMPAEAGWRGRPQTEIRLNAVSYRYDERRPHALSKVSLSIPAGACVGLIGANGSGKTTLVDLIAGLLVPDSGRVEIDGVALDDSNRAAWQTRIAYVPQNIFLLDATLKENITLAAGGGPIDLERLASAIKLAELQGVANALPLGLDHPLGERGGRLSGGQRQRIGIARALYRDASVLLLDEATNALDGLTEQELLSTIAALRGRYTIILIAHSLSTVRSCDVIFELDRGRLAGRSSAIAASGS
jgi:HlyD family secretion protein